MVCSKYFSKGQLHFQCHRTEALPVFAFMLCCTASPWALYLKPLSCLIFSAMPHTRENGKGDLSPFQMLPKAGRNQWEAQTHPWGLEAKDTAEVLLLAKESPLVTQGAGCTSTTGVTVLTVVTTFVPIYLWSTSWAPKAGNWHGKTSWHNIWQGSEWHESKWWKQELSRYQETSCWKHPKYPTPLLMLVTEIGKLSSESKKTLQVTKPRALIQQEDSGVTQTTELQGLI